MADKQLFIGVDLGGTKILAGVVEDNGKVISRAKKKTQADQGPAKVIGRIAECVQDAMAAAGVTKVTAVGVGSAGAIDYDRGVILEAGNLGWKNFPLREMLAKELSHEAVVVDNDVNAGAYGEWKLGAGKNAENLLAVFVGTGIGGGLVLNGRLYRGQLHTAGEIGHTVINTGGATVTRTLEDLASRGAMGAMLARRMATGHASSLSEYGSPEKVFSRLRSGVLANAFKFRDAETIACVHETACYVGTGVANAVTLLSLPRVVLGGGVVEALGQPYVDLVAEQIRRETFPPGLKVQVAMAKLADDAVMVGAAMMARDRGR